MSDATKPFRYRLAAVLKKDRWDGQVLGAEAERARTVVEECLRRERQALAEVGGTESELRELCASDRPLPLERRRLLELFLRHQYAVAEVRALERKQAESVYAQVLAQLLTTHRSIKTMEHHEDRQRRAHESEQARAALRAHDEAWLLRLRKETQP